MAQSKTTTSRTRRRSLKFISLYCGAGGLDIGFQRAGFTPVQSIDINKDAIRTYRSIFPEHEVLCGDATTLVPHKNIDLVIGGPPCQGFSVAGYANPNDPRSKHVINFMSVVQKTRPKVFVMENVKALAQGPKWNSNRKKLIKLATKLGYEAKFFILDASQYGVPQKRERMFFIGVKGNNSLDLSPKKSRPLTVRNVLSKLPPYGSKGNLKGSTAKIVLAKRPVIRGSAYSGMFFNGKGRILDLDRPALTLPASMGGNHTPIIDQRCLDDCAPNWAKTCFDKLRNGKTIKRLPKHLRRLTVEEAALLQTFPKAVKFHGPINSQFKQIGNAVPPKLAFFVAKEIKDHFFK